jgi:hypothetical protein
MTESTLSQSAVSVLSGYLVRKSEVGPAAYSLQLENLYGVIEAKFSTLALSEIFARFVADPSDTVESKVLQLHLTREADQDPAFDQQLRSALVNQKTKANKIRGRRSRWKLPAACAAVALVALVGVFIAGRFTAPMPDLLTAPPTTVTVTTTPPPIETTSSASTTTSPTSTTPSGTESVTLGVPGDGSSAPKGAPVLLVKLPRPNDAWDFNYGDHDVQLTQFSNSLWNMLNTCNSGAYRGEQVFRLKNFTRLEAKAVGTDSKADPGLAVKYEVFVNDDDVNAKQTVIVNPGEMKPLTVDLPTGTFALKLRTSLTTATGKPCRSGNAVWGSPYVIAAGG